MTIKDTSAYLGNTNAEEKFEPCMINKALELFERGKSISYVCAELDISRETYYRWRDDKENGI